MKNPLKGSFFSSRVQEIAVEQIRPNPQQPRQSFDTQGLRELSQSIRTYGVLQPLTVRRVAGGYELVAGERRLRAAQLAGLRRVPCLTAQIDEQDSAFLALIENLQRRDLDYWEEAAAIARLIRSYGLSQEAAAERLGKSQSAVANKLRLLRLPQSVRRLVQESGLTERHARALLRLEGESEQLRAVQTIVQHGWNVAQTEAYIEEQLREVQLVPPKRRTTYIIKDVRLFLNSVDRGVDLMRRAGVNAACGREETDDEIMLTIRIPKRTKREKTAEK